MPYTVLRGRWCNIIVSNVQATSEAKSDGSIDSFLRNQNRSWENIKENFRTSAKEKLDLYELKKRKQWFDEQCSRYLDKRMQVKMQWLQNQNQSIVQSLNNEDVELVDISTI